MSGLARIAVVALAGVVLAAGCGEGDGPGPERSRATATATATVTATPTATAPAAPRARSVRFEAADGEPVTAKYTAAGRDAPAVVLLHEIRGGPDQWKPLVPYLHDAGFATLAYQSRASALERERMPDLLGAIRWLRARPDVDPRRIGLVGASIGASTAVYAMAAGARRTAAAAVALSPPDSSDIWALQDHDRYRPHDILFASDDREATSAKGMLDGAVRSKAIRSDRPGHGVVLLEQTSVREALLAWLEQRLHR